MIFRNKIVLTTLALLFSYTSLEAQTQRGTASYYSKRWTGRKTANGERLHHDSLTCAHKTYPFGTLRAAKELGIISQGIAPVIVERYDSSIIPFKPAEIDLPEFDIGTNEGSDSKPLWLELKELEMQKIREQNAHSKKTDATHNQSQPKVRDAEKNKVSMQSDMRTNKTKETNDLDEINSAPNKSKAYLKRHNNASKESK